SACFGRWRRHWCSWGRHAAARPGAAAAASDACLQPELQPGATAGHNALYRCRRSQQCGTATS
ncbi:unnamed protein product, partial [Symbiodinium sp. CCMP2456]